MKPFLTALLVIASLLFSSVGSRAQIPILAGAYRDNPLKLTYTFVGLYQKPVITAVAKRDANGLPLAANLQPKVTTTPDPVVPGVYAVVVGYDTTSNLPINSWLEIKLNGQVFAAGPVTIDRTNRSGSYAVFVNTVTLITTSGLNVSNGNSGGGVDLTQVTNLLKDKVDKVTGKDLSTNDFTDVYRNKLDTLTGGGGATVTPVFAAVRSITLAAGATPTASITGPITAMTLTVGIPPGKDGLPGTPGNPGTNGVTPVFASVVSSTLAAGSTPTVSVTGPASSLTLAIGIPAGPAGTPGAAGPPNSLTVGTVTTGAPGSAVTFTITGTPPNQVVNVSIPQGFSGTPGTNGVSPNLTIGSIATGAPGSSASATISGTFPNLVLNLTIPQGTAGTGGSTPIANNLTTTATGSALDATQGKALKDLSDTKVDKVTGKVLSTNDYTSADQAKVAATSGTNTGDETAAGIRSKLGITTLSGSNTGDQIPANNLTTTTTGTALDASQGKVLKDAVDANASAIGQRVTTTTFESRTLTQQQTDQQQNTNINSVSATASQAQATAANNTTAIAGKQDKITSGTSLTVGSVTLTDLSDSDSTLRAITSAWFQRNKPRFVDVQRDNPAQFDTAAILRTIRTDFIRGLFSAGTGITISAAGVISSTATGGSSSTNVVTATDPSNTANQATFILSPGDRVRFGSVAKPLYALNFESVQTLESVPPFKSRAGNLAFGGDADATLWRINNVVSANSSSTGTGLDNGFKWYGSSSRFMKILEDNGDKAPVLMRLTTSAQLGVGTEAPTANLHVVGTGLITGNATFGASVTVAGPLSVSSVKFLDGTTLTTAPLASTATTTTRPGSVSAIVSAWNSATANATVHIQSGTYNMTGTTLIIAGKSNVTLKSDKDVTLFNTDGGTILLSNGNNTNVTIDGLTLTTSFTQASNTNDLSTSLLYTNEQGTNTGVEVKNCKFSAPFARMNLVTTSAYSSRKSGGNGQGKLQTNLSYHDNEFGPGGRMGIELTSHTNEDSLYTTIYMRNVSIKNNYFHDLGLLPRNGDGVKNGMGPSVSGPIEMVEIANNHLVDCNLLGIETAGAKRVNITDNVIDYVNQAFTGISVSDNTTRFDARDINIVGNQIRSKIKGINMYRVAETNAANNQVKVDQDTGDGGTVYIQECLGVTLTGGSVQGRANNTIRIDNSNQVQIGGGIRLKNDRVNFSLVSIFGSSAAPSTWVAVDADCMFVKSNGPSASGVVETIGTTSNITGVR